MKKIIHKGSNKFMRACNTRLIRRRKSTEIDNITPLNIITNPPITSSSINDDDVVQQLDCDDLIMCCPCSNLILSFFSQQKNKKATKIAPSDGNIPRDVPKGHMVVYVGRTNQLKRYVISITILNHPLFRALLDQARDEFGFSTAKLCIPCDDGMFLDILRCCR